jgi:DNA anti-recombination protein RmuC
MHEFMRDNWAVISDIAHFSAEAAIGAWLYLNRKNDRTQGRIEALYTHVDQRLDEQSRRLAQVETDVRHAPTHDDLGKIYDRINTVGGDVREMKGVLESAAKTVDRLQSYLLACDRKGS